MIFIQSKRFILSFLISLLFISFSAFGQERILSYDSYIDVEKDGSMIVTAKKFVVVFIEIFLLIISMVLV